MDRLSEAQKNVTGHGGPNPDKHDRHIQYLVYKLDILHMTSRDTPTEGKSRVTTGGRVQSCPWPFSKSLIGDAVYTAGPVGHSEDVQGRASHGPLTEMGSYFGGFPSENVPGRHWTTSENS